MCELDPNELESCEAWAAYRHGHFLFESVRAFPEEVRLWIQIIFREEIKANMHDCANVLDEHGISIEKVRISRIGG